MSPPRYSEPSAPPSNAIGIRSAIQRASAGPDGTSAGACRGSVASLIAPARGLSRLGLAAGRGDRRAARSEPLQRLDRVVELEVLDALLLELGGGHREPRVRGFVMLEQLVVGLCLAQQVAAKIGLADPGPVLVIRVRKLRHGDVGIDPAGLNRLARRRVITLGGQPESTLRTSLDNGLDGALAEAALAHHD